MFCVYASDWTILSYGIQECVNICVRVPFRLWPMPRCKWHLRFYNTTLWIIRCANDEWNYMNSVLKIVQVANAFSACVFSFPSIKWTFFRFCSVWVSLCECLCHRNTNEMYAEKDSICDLVAWKLKLSMQNADNSATFTYS